MDADFVVESIVLKVIFIVSWDGLAFFDSSTVDGNGQVSKVIGRISDDTGGIPVWTVAVILHIVVDVIQIVVSGRARCSEKGSNTHQC